MSAKVHETFAVVLWGKCCWTGTDNPKTTSDDRIYDRLGYDSVGEGLVAQEIRSDQPTRYSIGEVCIVAGLSVHTNHRTSV